MAKAPKPKILEFPLWEGQDTRFIARRKEQGKFVPYDPTTTARIMFISGPTIIEIPGVIEGDTATFDVRHEEVSKIRGGATWRVQFNVNGTEEAPVIGKVSRKYV